MQRVVRIGHALVILLRIRSHYWGLGDHQVFDMVHRRRMLARNQGPEDKQRDSLETVGTSTWTAPDIQPAHWPLCMDPKVDNDPEYTYLADLDLASR